MTSKQHKYLTATLPAKIKIETVQFHKAQDNQQAAKNVVCTDNSEEKKNFLKQQLARKTLRVDKEQKSAPTKNTEPPKKKASKKKSYISFFVLYNKKIADEDKGGKTFLKKIRAELAEKSANKMQQIHEGLFNEILIDSDKFDWNFVKENNYLYNNKFWELNIAAKAAQTADYAKRICEIDHFIKEKLLRQ